MPLETSLKQKLVKQFQRVAKDTGSPEVQVGLISARIKQLAPHFEKHVKDVHSRRGLQVLVNKRRKLLSYLKRVNVEAYTKLMKDLEAL